MPPGLDLGLGKPKLLTKTAIRREGAGLDGIGESNGLAKAVLQEAIPGTLLPDVYEVKNLGKTSFIVASLIARQEPSMEEFAKQRDRLVDAVRTSKANMFLASLAGQRCLEVKARIIVVPGFVDSGDARTKDAKSAPKRQYEPCSTMVSP